MDWELAKELREAGFPQEPRQDFVADPENPENVATVPNLRQLVDACGDFLGGFAPRLTGSPTRFSTGRDSLLVRLLGAASGKRVRIVSSELVTS